jgi:hypothetical protein
MNGRPRALEGRRIMTSAVAVLGACVALGGCSHGGSPQPNASAPEFPADYADSYTEVRACRKSGDHELDFVRVLVDPSALGPYTDRTTPFPEGAVALKEQYDLSDTDCSGPIVAWTVMQKHAAATERLGWDWQRVSPERAVLEENTTRCFGCHTSCSGPPGVGYDYTCTEP